jgi:D-alanyl-D-alanine dipeptidase
MSRACLSSIMTASGFRSYDVEWWHYSLAEEPYPDMYFDFPIT